jgi:hypothetical protein
MAKFIQLLAYCEFVYVLFFAIKPFILVKFHLQPDFACCEYIYVLFVNRLFEF